MSNVTTLIGWNAKRNVGDDAMTVAFLEILKNHSTKIIFVCDKEEDSLLFTKSYPQIEFDYVPLHKTLAHTRGIKGIYYRWFLPIYLVLKSDEIIIGGGTLFHTSSLLKFYNNILVLRRFLKKKVKIIAACVSIGPFRDNKAPLLFENFTKHVDQISVRDERSFIIGSKINSKITQFHPDIALSIPSFKSIEVKKANKVSILLRQGYVNENEVEWLNLFLEQVHELFPEIHFEFIAFCDLNNKHENDNLAIEKVLNYSTKQWTKNVSRLDYNSDPIIFYKALKKSKFNICMRLHASVISYATETNFITLKYHQKCEDFFNLMKLDKKFLVQDFDNYVDHSQIIKQLINETIIHNAQAHEQISKSKHHLDFLFK